MCNKIIRVFVPIKNIPDCKRIFAVRESASWPLDGADLFEVVAHVVSLTETFRAIVHSQMQLGISGKNNISVKYTCCLSEQK